MLGEEKDMTTTVSTTLVTDILTDSQAKLGTLALTPASALMQMDPKFISDYQNQGARSKNNKDMVTRL